MFIVGQALRLPSLTAIDGVPVTRGEIRLVLLPRVEQAYFAQQFGRTYSIAAVRHRCLQVGLLRLFQTNPWLHGIGHTPGTGSLACAAPILLWRGVQQKFL